MSLLKPENFIGTENHIETTAKEKEKFSKLARHEIKARLCELTEPSRTKGHLRLERAAAITDQH